MGNYKWCILLWNMVYLNTSFALSQVVKKKLNWANFNKPLLCRENFTSYFEMVQWERAKDGKSGEGSRREEDTTIDISSITHNIALYCRAWTVNLNNSAKEHPEHNKCNSTFVSIFHYIGTTHANHQMVK